MTVTADPYAAFLRGAGVREPRETYAGPAQLMVAIDATYRITPAIDLVSQAFAEEMTRHDGRLIITMPPQEGKSTTTSRGGVLWLLHRDPGLRIILAAYQPELSYELSYLARSDITVNSGGERPDLGIRLMPDRAAVGTWKTTRGGGLTAVGIGTAITGRPADALLIDDPIKGRMEADSPLVRERFRQWFKANGASRLAPGAPICLTLTRWHHDDPAGWLQKEFPGWRVVHIPAQADPDIVDPDPLGRAPGEFMESARGRTIADWMERKRLADDEWAPLYQGSPVEPGGTVFDVDRLRYWHLNAHGDGLVCGPNMWLLRDATRFITMDTASSTARTADWTVAACWAVQLDGSLALLDVARDRVPEHKQLDLARPLVERWNPEAVYVEPSWRSTLLAREATVAGWVIRDLPPDKDKGTRAAPAARRVGDGRVWFPATHPLLKDLITELKEFPNGRHDDFVDTFGYAALIAHQVHVPAGTGSGPPPQSEPDRYGAALGVGAVDYGSTAF